MPSTDLPRPDPANEAQPEAANPDEHGPDLVGPEFRFLPKELVEKCRKLVESYHGINGYRSLPDMLWHSAGRDVIERSPGLMQIFANASKSRSAKRANDSFLQLATTIVAVEMLARDQAGWGQRQPEAKQEADRLLGASPASRSRQWLIDMYLYPSARRDLAAGQAGGQATGIEPSAGADPLAARS